MKREFTTVNHGLRMNIRAGRCEGFNIQGAHRQITKACKANGVEERWVAGQKIRFCKKHAKEWDNVFERALMGFPEEEDIALQKQGPAKAVPCAS